MTEARTPEWCRNLGALSDRELGLLTECAVAVIAEGAGDDPDVRELRELPPSALAPDLADALSRSGVIVGERQIDQLCEDSQAGRALAIALLQQACAIPALRAEIDAAYVARGRDAGRRPGDDRIDRPTGARAEAPAGEAGRDGLDGAAHPVRNVIASIIKDLLGS